MSLGSLRFAVLIAGLTLGAVSPAFADSPRVGHRVEKLVVPGSTLCPSLPNPSCVEKRQVKVHLWYPADQGGFSAAPATIYRSALYGLDLLPQWAPLGWQVEAEVARETEAIETRGKPFPVIVFSHGSTNDPIDYAHTLEQLAGSGFLVAAPYHVNNTQDDVRIDVVNAQAAGTLPCNDGRPGHQLDPRRPPGLVRRPRGHVASRGPGTLARDRHRAGCRGRQHRLGVRA